MDTNDGNQPVSIVEFVQLQDPYLPLTPRSCEALSVLGFTPDALLKRYVF